jgi:hypothetical protein
LNSPPFVSRVCGVVDAQTLLQARQKNCDEGHIVPKSLGWLSRLDYTEGSNGGLSQDRRGFGVELWKPMD